MPFPVVVVVVDVAAAAAAAVVSVVVPLAAAVVPVVVVLPPAAAATAPPAPCETSAQLPNPPAVVNETRQLAPSAPPVHVVPAGSDPETWTEPTVVGAATPFFVIVTAPPVKELPVPEGSTCVDVISVEPSLPLRKVSELVEANKVDGDYLRVEILDGHGEGSVCGLNRS